MKPHLLMASVGLVSATILAPQLAIADVVAVIRRDSQATQVRRFDLSGNALSSFGNAANNHFIDIDYDEANDTFYGLHYNSSETRLVSWSSSGTTLSQTLVLSGLDLGSVTNQSHLAVGIIAIVPEAPGWILIGVVGLCIFGARHTRRLSGINRKQPRCGAKL